MASTPVRFPSGIATNLPKTTLAFFPQLPATYQLTLINEFVPFRGTDFTLTQLNGTFTPFVWNSGCYFYSSKLFDYQFSPHHRMHRLDQRTGCVVNLLFANRLVGPDRKSTRLNSSHPRLSRMPSSA